MNIGLLGGGTVGTSVVQLLAERQEALARQAGEALTVKAVLVRNGEKRRPAHLAGLLTTDPARVVDDPDIGIVVEALGGVEPARTWALRALAQGKSLVTANKALLAAAGPELFAMARRHGGIVRFEAAVAAAVPVVAALREVLVAERLDALAGVLNGSTNYLLDAMEGGLGQDEAMARARRAGYLEADPSEDVDGWDSARKLVLLAALAWGEGVPLGSFPVHGIGDVTAADVRGATTLGARLRLLAWARRDTRAEDGEAALSLAVEPALVPSFHPLARLAGASSAVALFGEPGGETFLAASGAGGGPTALAVVGDVVAAARLLRRGGGGDVVPPAWRHEVTKGRIVESPARYAFRVEAVGEGVGTDLAGWDPVGANGEVEVVAAAAPSHRLSLVAIGEDAFWCVTEPTLRAQALALRESWLHRPAVGAVGPLLRVWEVPTANPGPLFDAGTAPRRLPVPSIPAAVAHTGGSQPSGHEEVPVGAWPARSGAGRGHTHPSLGGERP